MTIHRIMPAAFLLWLLLPTPAVDAFLIMEIGGGKSRRTAPSASGSTLFWELRQTASDLRESSGSTNENAPPKQETSLWNLQDLEAYCNEIGIDVSLSTFGPGYRSVARASHDPSLILGYVEGFVRPAGKILHLDKMEAFQPVLQTAKAQVASSPGRLDFGGISFGAGLIMGYRCLLHAVEKNCIVAEFLAIDDADFQHKRLVRYYRRVGFQVVKYVGENFADIPDRLVWGGCGTLMREDVQTLMKKWSALLTIMRQRAREASTSATASD